MTLGTLRLTRLALKPHTVEHALLPLKSYLTEALNLNSTTMPTRLLVPNRRWCRLHLSRSHVAYLPLLRPQTRPAIRWPRETWISAGVRRTDPPVRNLDM